MSALMVVGAASNAGKSTVVAALCRAWAHRSVAPFKAQNMSTLCSTTPDGGRVAVAQAMQARAARVTLERRMNPVLLRPLPGGSASEVVVLGEPDGVTGSREYGVRVEELRDTVLDSLASLRSDFDLVVLEGAGGAAEINLLERDLVNLPLAAATGIPAVLVVDIDRGGAFASAYGTWALLPDHLRAALRGFVLNRFRGDPSLLDAGIAELERRTGVPVLGVLPHLGFDRLWSEDSLDGAVVGPVDDADLDAQLDLLGAWVGEHLDLDALLALADTALPAGRGPGWA